MTLTDTSIGTDLAGLPLTLALVRFIRGNLYGVTTTNPLTFLATATTPLVVMLVATWIPARCAT
jgi:hypothetical protein